MLFNNIILRNHESADDGTTVRGNGFKPRANQKRKTESSMMSDDFDSSFDFDPKKTIKVQQLLIRL